MQELIYRLPRYDNVVLEPSIQNDSNPCPKLIKYGFNNISKQLDLVSITNSPQYKAALEFDFDRTDPSSISTLGSKELGVTDFDSVFSQLWELMTVFGFYKSDQKIYSTTETVESVFKAISSFTKSKLKSEYQSKPSSDTTLSVYRYSDIDLAEESAAKIILDNIPSIINTSSPGSNLILQIYDIQTQITSEIIYLLSNYYADSYIYVPAVVSALSSEKYLVCTNFKKKTNLKLNTNNAGYICSMGLKIPHTLTNVIQCLNAKLMPAKYHRYNTIKAYLDTKIFEGATYENLLEIQNQSTMQWLEIFGNAEKWKSLLDSRLEITDSECKGFDLLSEVYANVK